MSDAWVGLLTSLTSVANMQVNFAWTVIISLITSVIGGLLASWLVLRKSESDLKRVYAHQIWPSVLVAFETIYSHLKTFVNTLDESTAENIKLSVHDEQTIKEFNGKIRSWRSNNDYREKISKCDRESLVTILTWLTEAARGEQGNFRQLFAIYPVQLSHFSKCYQAKFWLETVFDVPTDHLADLEANALAGYTDHLVALMPDTILRLRHAYLDVDRFVHPDSRPNAFAKHSV